jgi:hypothetical protein
MSKRWDSEQEAVIKAPPDARLLIDAGPGTGKTAVAIARIKNLVESHGVEPSRIWFVSFSRTAVKEARDRIRQEMQDNPGAAEAINVRTIDAHAWSLRAGFEGNELANRGFEHNIESLRQLLVRSEELRDYIGQVEHLMVDEAQDVLGARAGLLLDLVEAVPPTCGITILADEAQAIYGFSEEDSEERPQALVPGIQARGLGFRNLRLSKVYRTSAPNLAHIFRNTREMVMSLAEPTRKLEAVRRDVLGRANGVLTGWADPVALRGQKDLFVLHRHRAAALITSTALLKEGVAHRVRMRGVPVTIPGWVAAALATVESDRLGRKDFLRLWESNVAGSVLAPLSAEAAWMLLVQHAGETETMISLTRLRHILSSSRIPHDFLTSEVGNGGVVVGTIHASKGREAARVHLMLPETEWQTSNQDEEARIVFVGATRARSELLVGTTRTSAGKTTKNDRTWRKTMRGGIQIQVGLERDILAEGLCGRRHWATPDAARSIQERLRLLSDYPARAHANYDLHRQSYVLQDEVTRAPLGILAPHLEFDMREIARSAGSGRGFRRPDQIWHLYVVGVRSLVLPPDSPEAATLHAPWGSSGFMLAPVILGFPTTNLVPGGSREQP